MVKVCEFLDTYVNDVGFDEKYRPFLEQAMEKGDFDPLWTNYAATRAWAIAEYQLVRIRNRLDAVMRFMIQQLYDRESPFFTISKDGRDRPNIYYLTMTIWYIVRNHLPQKTRITLVKDFFKHADAENGIKHISKTYPDHEVIRFGKDKILLLQWYHYGCVQKLFQLCGHDHIPNPEQKVHQLKSAALVASAAKLSAKRPYSANDEIIDRLSFLAHELGLETNDDRQISVASMAARRVSGRDFTRYLNPGFLNPGQDGSTDGPWEVHALCHHSRLLALSIEHYNDKDWRTVEQRAEEVNLYKEKICQFLNSETTLIACWERSYPKARKGFIQSEASSVFGSTLLDIHGKGLDDKTKETTEAQDTRKTPRSKSEKGNPAIGAKQPDKREEVTGAQGSETGETRENGRSGLPSPDLEKRYVIAEADGQKKVVQELVSIGTLLAQQLKTTQRHMPEAGQAPPIEWIETWRPPRQYHPDNFLESLDDTPDLYRKAYIANKGYIEPSLGHHVTKPADLKQDFTRKSLENLEREGLLEFVHLEDIRDAEEDDLLTKAAREVSKSDRSTLNVSKSSKSSGASKNASLKKNGSDICMKSEQLLTPEEQQEQEVKRQKDLVNSLHDSVSINMPSFSVGWTNSYPSLWISMFGTGCCKLGLLYTEHIH